MKAEQLIVLVIAVGLIFGSIATSTPSVMTQNYAYASTDHEEDNLAETPDEDSPEEQQEEDSVTQTEETQTESEDEDQAQSLSGSKSKKDTNGPTIASRSPNVGTVTIPVNTNIKVTFSEPVEITSVTSSSFQLKKAGDTTEVPGIVSLDADGKTATFDPTSDLSSLQSYTVTLTSGVKDLAGNTLNSENWSFTTEGQSSGGTGGNTSSGGSTSSTASDPGVLRGSGEIDVLQEAAQFEADSKLLDRLLPMLLQKIDGKQLLEKILPYLDVRVSIRDQSGPSQHVEISGLATAPGSSIANCNEDEVSTGGGFLINPDIGARGEVIPISSISNGPSAWKAQVDFLDSGSLQAFAKCMKVEVGIKGSEGLTTRSGTIDTASDLGIKTSKDLDILKEPVP